MEHLGDLYYEIRFTSLTFEELEQLDESYASVLEHDFEIIGFLILFPELLEALKRKPETKFNLKRRNC